MKFQSDLPRHQVEISKSISKNWVSDSKTCKEASKGSQVWILEKIYESNSLAESCGPVRLQSHPTGKELDGAVSHSALRGPLGAASSSLWSRNSRKHWTRRECI